MKLILCVSGLIIVKVRKFVIKIVSIGVSKLFIIDGMILCKLFLILVRM